MMTLTDEELSRWICDKLEPLHTVGLNRVNGKVTSFEGFWTAGDGWESMPSKDKLKPRDMVNDPAMTVMLLIEVIRQSDVLLSGLGVLSGLGDRIGITLEHLDVERIAAEKLGRAVAEAFALANGWKR
jgi:hypothetical protein